jgi:hypothetical protein
MVAKVETAIDRLQEYRDGADHSGRYRQDRRARGRRMSTPFEIESFEEYLQTVRNELPEGRKYFRGQTKLVSAGYELKPSIGRYDHLLSRSPSASATTSNARCSKSSATTSSPTSSTCHAPTGRRWPLPSTMVCRRASWTGPPIRWSPSTSRCGRPRRTTTAVP